MCASLQRRPAADGPTTAGHAALAALLAGLVLVRIGVGHVAGTLRSETGLLGVPAVVTLAYSVVALAALGAVYAAFSAHAEERLDRAELTQAGLAVTPLVVVAVYVAFDRLAVGVSAAPVARAGGYLVAVGLLAVGYARVADLEVPTTPPTRDGWVATGLAVAAVAASAGLAAVGASLLGWPGGPFASFRYPSTLSVPSFVLATAVPTAITAVGTALLFNGAVQSALRRHRSPAAAAGAVTLLAFAADWVIAAVPPALGAVAAPVPSAVRWAVVLAALVVAVLAVLAAAVGYGRVWDERAGASMDDYPTLGAVTAAGAAGVGLALAVATALGGSPGPAVVSYAVAVGAGAVAFERTQTVWAPTVVYAAHGIAIALATRYVVSGGAGGDAVTVGLSLL
ncbi:hypothetical protein [Halosimplex halobium]|uniref:hypothetical protein n=1 Tax=Halosimplex halobium TaxID=3396618 RepID=UPI003F57F94D